MPTTKFQRKALEIVLIKKFVYQVTSTNKCVTLAIIVNSNAK